MMNYEVNEETTTSAMWEQHFPADWVHMSNPVVAMGGFRTNFPKSNPSHY